MNKRQSIHLNHISSNLTTEKVNELRTLYDNNHKNLVTNLHIKNIVSRKLQLSFEVIICSRRNSISSCNQRYFFTVFLQCKVFLSAVAILVQAYLKQKNIDSKLTNDEHTLNEIKRYLRDGEFNDHDLILELQLTDDEIIEFSPNVDKQNKTYD